MNTTAPTPAFQARLVDPSGRLQMTVDIMAENDDEAIEQARGLAVAYVVEVVDRDRLLARIPINRRGR